MTDRRTLLKYAGLLAASLPLGSQLLPGALAGPSLPGNGSDAWAGFRSLFELDPDYAHFANFLITSHPKPVRDAIEDYRAKLDRHPAQWVDWETQAEWKREGEVRDWAARYLEVKPRQIALTGSTTEGLGLIYGGLKVAAHQEILTTEHEHYSTRNSLAYRATREGTQVRKIRLFRDPQRVSDDEVLGNIAAAIRPSTRVLGMTWVHSGSGVKLPIGAIGELVREHNRNRDEQDRILYVVDGVHGFGVEDMRFADLKCDYFISGTHKWMFGPRGTGIICAASTELKDLVPTFATFSENEDFATIMSPGGYHAFEHRWALGKAFELHLQVGKAPIQARIHGLNDYLKQRLAEYKAIELVTPRSPRHSSGFTFFRVKGQDADEVAAYLTRHRIVVDAVSRDVGPVVRAAPGLLNTEAEIDRLISVLGQRLRA
ncbi:MULTISPECIES: aminotransferase class V-fold PLP-dependent enzyme [Pseudomonas]|jgi:selenocysteine lyase/cysteine desulfurase|uniref:Selenocysteine lyase/cysteine desulfurase n=1 Tax=Pseudomonas putida TaxID=303 RepID=A0A9X8EQU5_PSEPU|nr:MULTISPECIES: aminotransferase class V-fold PLP-dependent enzyme [Pseudomonas]KIU47924.1 class V aminotransferase [Pseudomonas putida]KTC17977.1 class V aminotransferase [Pseudomonas putida]MBG8561618.1 aminotransferase class V-fold PLP-dependent enzyme [Pseudomonas qingdaonensis]OOW02595.1 class V aminotransferase [Pseudomonas sp. MF6396]ROQ56308.1 selenocysteine lyase/cysteine desulfurase [Pseudomonas putida]